MRCADAGRPSALHLEDHLGWSIGQGPSHRPVQACAGRGHWNRYGQLYGLHIVAAIDLNSGVWAMECAEALPNAEVIGTDL